MHGRTNLFDVVQSAETKGVRHIVQVGDLSCFWPGPKDALDRWIIKRAEQKKWTAEILTCGGNHENWDLFDKLAAEQDQDKVELYPGSGVFYVRRGAALELDGISHLFLGGAESTDKHKRVEGLNLWEQREEPNKEEFALFKERFNSLKPDTVVTHDAPLRVNFKRLRRNSSKVPNFLEDVLKKSKHRPRRWYFGHHHVFDKWKIDSVKYYCCGLHGQYWSRE